MKFVEVDSILYQIFFFCIFSTQITRYSIYLSEHLVCVSRTPSSQHQHQIQQSSAKSSFFFLLRFSDEGIKGELLMRKFRALRAQLLSAFLSCIANMNNFSWLNEKVMPSLETRAHRRLHSLELGENLMHFRCLSNVRCIYRMTRRLMKIYMLLRVERVYTFPIVRFMRRAWRCTQQQRFWKWQSCLTLWAVAAWLREGKK